MSVKSAQAERDRRCGLWHVFEPRCSARESTGCSNMPNRELPKCNTSERST